MKTLAILVSLLLSLCLGVSSALAAPVNVNEADEATLAESLNGVGPKIAAKIVAYRKEHGPFRSAEDLMNVKGIGPRIIERNIDDILVGETQPQQSQAQTPPK